MKYEIDIDSLPEVPKPSAWEFVNAKYIFKSVALCAFWIPILFFVITLIFGDWMLSWTLYFLLIIVISILANVVLSFLGRSSSYAWKKKSDKDMVINSSNNLNSLISQSVNECNNCRELVKKIRFDIEVANEIYNRRFFAKFWDKIEEITQHFGEYHKQIQRLSRIQNDYKYNIEKIKHIKHNFPEASLKMGIVPAAYRELNAFNKVVGFGESDFHFASIWESRRTREVLIAGFKTLQASIEGVGAAIQDELKSLNNKVKLENNRLDN